MQEVILIGQGRLSGKGALGDGKPRGGL